MTMQLVQTITVGAGGAASIEFTGIPQTGTDLFLVISGRNTSTSTLGRMRFNGDSGSNYTGKYLYGSPGLVFSGNDANIAHFYLNMEPGNATASTFGNIGIYIPNYSGSSNKSVSFDEVTETNASATALMIRAGVWAQTSAITSITLYAGDGDTTFTQYSSASLYLVTKGSGGASVS